MRTARILEITYKPKMTTFLTLYKIYLKNIKIVFNRKIKKNLDAFGLTEEHGVLTLSIN